MSLTDYILSDGDLGDFGMCAIINSIPLIYELKDEVIYTETSIVKIFNMKEYSKDGGFYLLLHSN